MSRLHHDGVMLGDGSARSAEAVTRQLQPATRLSRIGPASNGLWMDHGKAGCQAGAFLAQRVTIGRMAA